MIQKSGLKQRLRIISKMGRSMQLRLFLFLLALATTMILGIVAILFVTGTLTAGIKESSKFMERELNYIHDNIYKQFGSLSVLAVELSSDLSKSIEASMAERGYEVTDIKNHPELLEGLVSSEYQRMLFSLAKSKSSGVFLILNTTFNDKLENADNSRAGLYIKNMEPNIISSSSPTIVLLRGFVNIGRKNSIPLHVQWSMEFDVSDAPYYHIPMQEASKSKLPLSRLYYWSPAVTLPGCSEEVMLCSVPLIDSNGNVFGVCGFEISAMLFKLSQMPDSSKFARTFCLLAPIKDDIIDSSAALYSGGYPAQNLTLKEEDLHIEKKTNSLFSYAQESGDIFVGLHRPVRLYPEDSAFAKHKWISAIMIPAEDIKYSLTRFNLQLAFLLMLLMILGAVISFFLSRQYLKPIVDGIDMIKAKGLKGPPRTNIPEIDDLIEFLSMHNEKIQEQKDDTLASEVLDKFLENTKTLSPAERAVFDLYVEGYNAKEISEKLCLSINTIKTHNKRIYMKLNVASRKELLLYVQMLKEAGREP